jgi:hypothetical protein
MEVPRQDFLGLPCGEPTGRVCGYALRQSGYSSPAGFPSSLLVETNLCLFFGAENLRVGISCEARDVGYPDRNSCANILLSAWHIEFQDPGWLSAESLHRAEVREPGINIKTCPSTPKYPRPGFEGPRRTFCLWRDWQRSSHGTCRQKQTAQCQFEIKH